MSRAPRATEYSLPSEPLSVAGRRRRRHLGGQPQQQGWYAQDGSLSTLTTLATGHINYIASVSSDRALVLSSPDHIQFYDGLRFVTSDSGLRHGVRGSKACWTSGPPSGTSCQYRRFDGMKWVSGCAGIASFPPPDHRHPRLLGQQRLYFATNYNSYCPPLQRHNERPLLHARALW